MTSGGNNFSNFPENQLTKFRAVSPPPCPDIIWGTSSTQKNIYENGVSPRPPCYHTTATHRPSSWSAKFTRETLAAVIARALQVQARIVEVQRQLHELEATLEMNPGQELSEDEARLVEQLENLKLEFGEMLYELRHKLNVHVTSDVIDDVSTQRFGSTGSFCG